LSSIEEEIKALHFVDAVTSFLQPRRADDTELDDYYKVNIKNTYDKNISIDLINQIAGVEWIEPNEVYHLEAQSTEVEVGKSNFSATVNDPLAGQQWNMEILNGKGIASMSPGAEWVHLSSVRVMNNFGYGTQARIVEGIIEAVDAGADVISMSLGGRSSQIKEESYDAAFEYAAQRNVIIVTAAGNNAGDAANITPANSTSVITVTAVDKSLNKAQFSNHISNTNNGIAAPGTSIVSSWKGGRYGTFDGTSMATPHVSGLIAVMRSINPDLTTKQAYTILKSTGSKTNQTNLTGKMINPTKAIKALK